MFRVVPDQLRISEGWVRCGQCDEVFDANAHLRSLEEQGPEIASEPRTEDIAVIETDPPAAVQTGEAEAYDWGTIEAPSKTQAEASAPMPGLGDESDAPQSVQEPFWEGQRTDGAEQVSIDPPEGYGFPDHSPHDLPASEELQVSHDLSTQVDDWVYQSPPVPHGNDPSVASDARTDAVPSFMPRSPQRRWGDRYLGPKVMLFVMLVLALLLSSQILLVERDRVAAKIPALRPFLDSSCALLGCTLSAPRQIESIAIDSSAFTRVKSGVYNLSLSLRNGAAIELAAPAMELTLTDMQDQVLVRRVLLPGEYSEKTLISAGAELVAEIPIAVGAGAASEKISGYKLLAFYP